MYGITKKQFSFVAYAPRSAWIYRHWGSILIRNVNDLTVTLSYFRDNGNRHGFRALTKLACRFGREA